MRSTGVFVALLSVLGPAPTTAVAQDQLTFDIPLRISAEESVVVPQPWLMTTGVPFENSQLFEKDFQRLRVVTSSGKSVPAQFETRGRYPSSKAVRWLGVYWQLDPNALTPDPSPKRRGEAAYRLVLSKEKTAAAAPQDPVQVNEDADSITVTTGDFKTRIPKTGGMIAGAWLKDQLVLDQDKEDGNWLTTLQGAKHRQADLKAVVERSGPLLATILVAGRYRDPAGKPSCRFEARLHVRAGRPEIEITHQFVWIGHSKDLQIADIALSFGLKQQATSAVVPRSAENRSKPFETELGKGRYVKLLQDELYHWGAGASHFGIQTGSAQDVKEVISGERAGSWMQARHARGAVTLVLREFWQRYPKALVVEPGRITAYLWATQGKALPFDLREANLKKMWGPKAEPFLKLPEYNNTWDDPFEMDPTGLARTHDMLLHFHGGRDRAAWSAEASALADAHERYPVATPDPGWIERSGVLDNFYSAPLTQPLSPGGRGLGEGGKERFPELAATLDQVWQQLLHHKKIWGDYGFLYYGQGPHGSYQQDKDDGRILPTLLMYGQTHPYPFWIACLHSGQREHFEHAWAHSRFYTDLMFCHETGPARMKGDFRWFGRRGTLPWSGYARKSIELFKHPSFWPQRGLYITLEFAPMHYYLTGDRFALEAVLATAQLTKEHIQATPNYAENLVRPTINQRGGYSLMWKCHALRVGDLAMFFELTEDPFFLEQSTKVFKELLDPNHPAGIRGTLEVGREKEGPVFVGYLAFAQKGFLRYLRIVEDAGKDHEAKLAREVLLGIARYQRLIDFVYWGGDGTLMAFAWRQTKDPRYLRLGLNQMDRLVGGGRPTAASPMNSVAVADTFRHLPPLLGALREADTIPPCYPLLVKHEADPAPLRMVLRKEQGKALAFEVTAHSEGYAGPKGEALKPEWLGKPTVFHASKTAFHYTRNLPINYYQARIPVEAPAGDYRIKIPASGFAALHGTDARHYVIEAPEGMPLAGPTGPALYFKVAGPLTISAKSGLARVVVRDAHGQLARAAIQKAPSGFEQMIFKEVPVKIRGIWSIQGPRETVVFMEGSPPVFSVADSARFYLPSEVPEWKLPGP